MNQPGSAPWRQEQAAKLLAFGRGSEVPGGGFGWIDEFGRLDSSQPRPLYMNSRMIYVYSLAHLGGDPDARRLAASGVEALLNRYRDPANGGWYASLDGLGAVSDTTKANYAHALTLLATATAHAAEVPGGTDAFAETTAVIERHFWSDEEGSAIENLDANFSGAEPYRGANSNMHSLEAYLVAGDVSGDRTWHERGLLITEKIINTHARAYGWRIPEHYDRNWRPVLGYNADRPCDQFRPYGTTPGHSFEWSRLLLALEAAMVAAPHWLLPAAIGLFDTAVADGWAPDSHPGFVYTVDEAARPVATSRLHWVVCEAVLAADFLARRTGEQRFADLAAQWWRHIDDHFVDHQNGGWWHELDEHQLPTSSTWSGKPDLYHAYQALLFPSLPMTPSAALTASSVQLTSTRQWASSTRQDSPNQARAEE